MSKLEQKNKKKLMTLICLIMILLVIYGGVRIYALFHSELNAKIKLVNGVWNIKVNETEISEGTNIEFPVDNITVQENEHVKSGNIAPGLTGSFKININPENTDVSVKYSVSLSEDKLTNNNIKIKSITETKQGKELIQTDKNTFTGVITLDEINQNETNEITVQIEWIDDESNDELDIKLGTSEDANYEVPITIYVCQYLGEEIIPYSEN